MNYRNFIVFLVAAFALAIVGCKTGKEGESVEVTPPGDVKSETDQASGNQMTTPSTTSTE
jgi:hypothetical protein